MTQRTIIRVPKGAGAPKIKRDWPNDTNEFASFMLESPNDSESEEVEEDLRDLVQVWFLNEEGNPRGGKFTYALPQDLGWVAVGDILLVPASGNICAVEVAEYGSSYTGPLKEALYNLEGEL